MKKWLVLVWLLAPVALLSYHYGPGQQAVAWQAARRHYERALRLEADGRFEVRTANNGFDAGMMVKEYHPDIIVLDVMLPDINGKEVCQRVRSDPALDDVRIICISGMVEQDKIQDLRDSGADQFLQKPFEVDQLIDRICRLLDIEQLAT